MLATLPSGVVKGHANVVFSKVDIKAWRRSLFGLIASLLGALFLAWWARTVWADRILWPAVATAAGVLMFDGVFSACAIFWFLGSLKRVSVGVADDTLEIRSARAVELARWMPPLVARFLAWRWENWLGEGPPLPPRTSWTQLRGGLSQWGETVVFNQRGEYKPQRRLRVWDLLGIWSVVFQVETPDESYIVLPSKIQKPSSFSLPLSVLASDDFSSTGRPEGDRNDFREYHEGDSARYIAWKLMARRGECGPILVRAPETVGGRRIGFVLRAGGMDESAAELMLYILETEPFGGDWAFCVAGGSGSTRIFSGRGDLKKAKSAIACSSAHCIAERAAVERSVRRIKRAGPCLVVIVTAELIPAPEGTYIAVASESSAWVAGVKRSQTQTSVLIQKRH